VAEQQRKDDERWQSGLKDLFAAAMPIVSPPVAPVENWVESKL
jgi:hypothetical protein